MQPTRLHAIVAVHLFLVRGDELLLLRRLNTGYEDGNYSVIAGHLDGGEPVLVAMMREAREEAGIDLDPNTTAIAGVMHRLTAFDERVDFFVVATDWTGEIVNREPEKCDELRWFPLDELPSNLIPYIRTAINAWQSGAWFTSHGFDVG